MQRYRLPLVQEAPIPDDIVLPQPIEYYYLASDVDARIAELTGLLSECLNTNENEHMDPDLVARVNRSLMDT